MGLTFLIPSWQMIILVGSTIILLTVCGLLVRSLLQTYRQASDNLELSQKYGNGPVLELLWTVIPTGMIVVLLLLTFRAI